ncbi:outer membrane-specific lipoprotein transporter subunit LolE [Klebsiella pneumoniae]|uniref:Outer membrane-specific lipoprotein transporter subunit LolE n=1 Tax=Klebsiella pneumoniae TaxID=573 RepID=A0A2X3EXK3_KLEPN|nr:outer membrane-specific lipoprotein transporter subunit LolE [Klebsiella pneumoniae]
MKGIVAAAPYINFTGLVESGSNMRAIQVKGVDPQQESQLSALPTFVQNNAWAGFKAGEQQVILGKRGRRCPAREAGGLGVDHDP